MWLLQVMGVVAFVSIGACSLKEKDNNNNINDNSERLTLQSQTAGGEWKQSAPLAENQQQAADGDH